VRFLGDVFLEDLRLCCLRVAEIHHLIQQFVDDDEVVADGFLLEFFEVFGKYLDDLVEEEEDLGGICVSFCEGKEVEVVVSYVEVLGTVSATSSSRQDMTHVYAFVGEAWRYCGALLFCVAQEDGELFDS